MTSTELREKLDKALANVEKRKATIEKHKALAEKKLKKLEDNGWKAGLEDTSLFRGNYEALTAISDYKWKLEDIKGATEKLEEAEEIAKNWEARYNKQLDTELKIATEVPEAFKEARAKLVESWVAFDIVSRDRMLEKRRELEYKEFRKLYKYSEEESLKHTDEEFRKIEEREADLWLLNLYNRVKDITGEVTDCSGVTWGGKCLDGYVEGKNGRAIVETIEAGGYNIQRWHLRVLVKECK